MLTTTPRALAEYTTFKAQEPPRKKPRLSDFSFKSADDGIQPFVDPRLESCLAQQVFPYVDRELSKLSRHKVDVEKLGTEVILFEAPTRLSFAWVMLTQYLPGHRRPHRKRLLH